MRFLGAGMAGERRDHRNLGKLKEGEQKRLIACKQSADQYLHLITAVILLINTVLSHYFLYSRTVVGTLSSYCTCIPNYQHLEVTRSLQVLSACSQEISVLCVRVHVLVQSARYVQAELMSGPEIFVYEHSRYETMWLRCLWNKMHLNF